MVGGDLVVEDPEPVSSARLVQPARPSPTVAGELEQELLAVAAVRNVIDLAVKMEAMAPWHGWPSLEARFPRRNRISKQLDEQDTHDISVYSSQVTLVTPGSWPHGYPGKPIVVLYFGDLDPKGLQTPESAVSDIREWCSADFEFVRCGLNPGDEIRLDIPERFDNPGEYQWEALSDDQARDLITSHVDRYLDRAVFEAVAERERDAVDRLRRAVA